MKKRYIIGATAALASAGLIVEMQAGPTSPDRIEILETQTADARVVAAEPMAQPGAESGGPAGAADFDLAALPDTSAGNPAGASDAELLLADTSPWVDMASPGGRRVGAPSPAMRGAFEMVGQVRSGYPLAGPINAARGDDALAAALSRPIVFGTVPQAGSWVSLLIGLAMVGYSLRRRNRLPSVSS